MSSVIMETRTSMMLETTTIELIDQPNKKSTTGRRLNPFEFPESDNSDSRNNNQNRSNHQQRRSSIVAIPATLSNGKVDHIVDDENITYPTSQFQCWLVVFGAFVGLLPAWGIANSLGVIQTHMLEDQLADVPTTTVSWIFSVYICLSLICTIFSGTYFDRNGSRLPIAIGSVLFVGSLVAAAECTKVYQFVLSFGLGLGAATGIVMSPIVGAVSHYFPKKKRATALGVAGNGGCMGGLLFPLMLRKSYVTVGFKWSMRLMALISLICLTVSFCLVKERRLVEKVPLTRSEKVKLYLTKSFDVQGLYTDKKYMFAALGCLFGEATVLIASTYFSFICIQYGFSQSEAFLFVTVINALAIAGRYLSGLFADKWFGSFNIIIFLLTATGAFNLVIWLPFKENTAALYVYSVFYGFFYGGIYSLIPNCCSQIVRADIFGRRYATMYAITGFILLGLIPASSAIIGDGDSDSRNSGFIVFVSILAFISAGCYATARCMCVGINLHKF